MARDTCRMPNCDRPTGQADGDDYRRSRFCSRQCDVKHDDLKADRPRRSEPADFGGGETTGVQEL